MTGWNNQELDTLGSAHEWRIAPMRSDGSLRKPVIVWAVRVGDDAYLRSVNGPSAAWFRGVQARHQGRINAGSLDRDVEFVDVDAQAQGGIHDDIDAAYRDKYGYSSAADHIVSAQARSATLKVLPRA